MSRTCGVFAFKRKLAAILVCVYVTALQSSHTCAGQFSCEVKLTPASPDAQPVSFTYQSSGGCTVLRTSKLVRATLCIAMVAMKCCLLILRLQVQGCCMCSKGLP